MNKRLRIKSKFRNGTMYVPSMVKNRPSKLSEIPHEYIERVKGDKVSPNPDNMTETNLIIK